MCRKQLLTIIGLYITFGFLFSGNLHAQLRINEILTANIAAGFNTSYNYTDWVEIYNEGSSAVNLNGYSLSDDPDDPEKFTIWGDIYVYPGQYFLITLDKRNYINDVYIHTNFSLDVEGEYLGIYNTSGAVVDSLYFGKQVRDASYGRLPGDLNTWRHFTTPSPGMANNTSWLSITETAGDISFSVEPGYYHGSISIEITANGTADRIVYTTNGTYPKESSATYSGPIYITENTVVRARCLANELHPGPVSSASYFIDEDIPNLPVVSLSTEDGHFYNWNYGYYCDGSNGVTTWCSDVPVNWARDWERPLNFEYFTQDGNEQFNQLVGSKIFGGCSRANALRSFSLISREDYGKKGMDYNFFVTKNDVNTYKSMVLRNSGSDVVASMLRDGFMQNLVIGRMDVDYQGYQPVLVYLNGQYFGLMNLREKMNEHYPASNYGIDPDEIDIIENGLYVKEGDDIAYLEMIDYVRTHDLSDSLQFEGMEALLDVNHYMDYYIANIYYENEDWPQNNVKFWREKKPGAKFRVMMYDTDCGFHLYPRSGNTLTWALRPHESTEIFVALMQNESFKNEFLQRFAAHMNTTWTPERVLPVLDSLEQEIEPHIRANISAYSLPYTYTTWDWHVNHTMVDFANTQADTVRIWLSNYFGLTGSYPLSISVDNDNYGWVEVNNVEVGSSYTGDQFRDIPVRLEANPMPGYSFVGWTGDVSSTSPEIYVTRSAATSIQALFTPAEPITGVYINEFMASNENGQQDESGEFEDWIELYNSNEYPLDLGGIFISDSAGDPGKHQIPYGFSSQTTVPANGYLVLWADKDTEQGALHLPFKLKRTGEIISLSQTIGNDLEFIDSLSYTEQYTDCSYGRDPVCKDNWKFLLPTPLALNEERYVSKLYINEFMASNQSVITDQHGEYDDWIEIYNDNEFPVDAGGLFISDSIGRPGKYRIPTLHPDSTTIPAKGFLLLWADDSTEQGICHLNFGLSGKGEEIILTAPNGVDVLDSISYPDLVRDAPYARHIDGIGHFGYLLPTPEASNILAPLENIFINEVVASNSGTAQDNHQEYDDWIEIYNDNDYPVNVGGLFITDDKDQMTNCRIPVHCPDSTLIEAKSFLLLWADDSTEQGILHLNFKLSSEGEFLGLVQANGINWLDSMSFSKQNQNISWGRESDGSEALCNQIPTPQGSNVEVNYDGILINEILVSDQTGFPDENGEYDDWIELYNPSEQPIDVAGMFISDSLGDPFKYQIPWRPDDSLIIPANEYLILWADNQPEQGVLHLGFKLRENGEQLGLFELSGQPLDQITYDNQYNNFSYSRTPQNKWVSAPPTYGTENTIPVIENVYINEYMADNDNRLSDEAGEFDDWIEIYNDNDYDVNLAGLYLTDSLNFPNQYRIPSSDPETTLLPAKSFMVFWIDSDSDQGPLHANFKLARKADNIMLSGYDYDQMICLKSWTKQPKNFATARLNETDTWMDMPPTPGASNIPPDYSGLYINEIMASNGSTIADNFGEFDDWIEIYNSGESEIDLGGLFISDSINDDNPYRISSEYPDSTSISPGEYLLIWADDSTEQGILHMDFKLSRSGESTAIYGLDRSMLIDSVCYEEIPTDNTWGRTVDGGQQWKVLNLPTPRASNFFTAIDETMSFNTSGFSYKIYPNPMVSHCVFNLYTERSTKLEIKVYNLNGELVANIFNEPVLAGEHEIIWDITAEGGRRIVEGIYFYTLETEEVFIRDKVVVGR